MSNFRKRPSDSRSNWSGVVATGDLSKVYDEKTKKLKPGVRVHGFVTKGHASTITKKHKSKNGKSYLTVEGTTHELPRKTQAAIAYALDNPNNDKAIIYDQRDPATTWQNDKKTGISVLVNHNTGEIVRTVDHNKGRK